MITENLLPLLRNCEIDISYKSDHSIILLELQFTVRTHGKGFWKFNNSVLEDIEYVNLINLKINDVIQQYCLPVYNIKNVLNIDRLEVQFVINDQLFSETLLMEIRGETISFSSHKIKTQNMRERFLQNKISEIELNLNDSNKDELVNLQKELENIRNEKMNGYFIRSRANSIDNGEKITKYFCNLEKQHIATKCIPFIEKEEGSRIFDQRKILEEAKSYYEKLYSEQEHIKDEDSELTFDLQNCDITKLNETQKNMIEGLLQYNEVAQTLKNMNNDKSLGIDGFSTNFYRVFWGKIGHFAV